MAFHFLFAVYQSLRRTDFCSDAMAKNDAPNLLGIPMHHGMQTVGVLAWLVGLVPWLVRLF